MIDFGGTYYIIDIEALSEVIMISKDYDEKNVETAKKTILDENNNVISTEIVETFSDRDYTIDSTKYETIRTMLDIVLADMEDVSDDSLGANRALEKASLAYKIAFNTLYNYGVLKEVE